MGTSTVRADVTYDAAERVRGHRTSLGEIQQLAPVFVVDEVASLPQVEKVTWHGR